MVRRVVILEGRLEEGGVAMDTHDALKQFKRDHYTGVNEQDFLHMLRKEAEEELERLKNACPRSRPKYDNAVDTAYDLIVDWFTHSDEFKTDDLAAFVAMHRISCVWAVFLGKRAQVAEQKDKIFEPVRDCDAVETSHQALVDALQGLFKHCSMVHKHWGEGCNQKEADAAIKAAHAALKQAEGG